MAISYGQFTGWVSVSYVVKSEPSCTSHKPRASYQRWLVRGDLVHGNCPHARTQSYMIDNQHKDTQFIMRMQRGKCNNGSKFCAWNDECWAQVVSVSILRCSLVPARYQGCSLINFHCYSSDLTLVHVVGCQVDVDSGVAFIRSYRKFFRYLIHYTNRR